MVTLLTGVGIWVLGEITKWLSKVSGKKISVRVVIAFLSLGAGAVYYAVSTSHPQLIEEATTFLLGTLSVSQIIWWVVDKVIPK